MMKNNLSDYGDELASKFESRGSLVKKRNACFKEHYKLIRMSAGENYPHGSYFDDEKGRYIRIYRGKGSRYLKKLCTRQYRRKYKKLIESGNGNSRSKSIKHKEKEYWWIIV